MNRNQRSIRNRGVRKSKSNIIDIDITSLLDILVILLVFLIKSYNASGVVLNVPKGVILPKSESVSLNTTGIIIQVSTDTIWVDDEEIVQDYSKSRSNFDHGGRRIIPLFNELVKKKNVIKQVEKTSPNAQKFTGMVNLIVDKTIKYSFLQKLMYTTAEAGFKRYKFIVLGEE